MTDWQDLTMSGFAQMRREHRTVILPVGSIEEHGAHLPLGTDAFHAIELAQRVAALHPVLVAPPIFYGLCRSTSDHPGTVSISGDTLRNLVKDLGREFYRQGMRGLAIVSGHAGATHMCALVEAGEAILREFPSLRVAVVSVLDLLREVLTAKPHLIKTPGDAHAGEVETALMLAAYPHLVQGTSPAEWPSFPKYLVVRDKRRHWPGGVWGDPSQATRAQGEAMLTAEAARLAEVIAALEEEGEE